MISASIERIRSEQDLCNLRVASAAQATKEGFQNIWETLSNQVGKTVEIDREIAAETEKEDVSGKAELRRMFGARK